MAQTGQDEGDLRRGQQAGAGEGRGHPLPGAGGGQGRGLRVAEAEDGDITPGDRPGLAPHLVLNQTTIRHQCPHPGRQGQRAIRLIFARDLPPAQGRAVEGLFPCGRKPDLIRRQQPGKGLGKEGVGQVDQGGTRAAGFAEVVEPATPLADIVDHIQAQTGIAAPEAVDGLLGIADEQHLIGQGGQAGKEGELDGAGILEFVHHQETQPGAQPVPGAGVLKGAQHQILLINEVQQAPRLLQGREGRHDVRRGGEQAADEGRDVGVKAGAF